MAPRRWIQLGAIASSLGFAGATLAADAGLTTWQLQNGMSPAGSVQDAVPAGAESVGGSERSDNTNAVPVEAGAAGYLQDTSPAPHEPVIAPDAGRALDVAPDEPHEMYRLPEDRDTLSDATPRRSTGGMQATPGYTAGSAKPQ